MTGDRYLIVNADDFGRTAGVNRGVVRSHELGIVTSASLMVRHPAAAEAAEYARAHGSLGVGLHVDLGEWVHGEDGWQPVYEAVAPDDEEAVQGEVADQVQRFRSLLGRDPTHLDSHQHVHQREPARSVLRRLAAELGVPLRHETPVRYVGEFYGQTKEGEPLPEALTADSLIALLHGLGPGWTELACHPGEAAGLESTYRAEREREVETLCDPRVRAAIGALGIELCSFADTRLAVAAAT